MSELHANFTAETCTGTGDTLELAGAVDEHIPFVESFADGDLVSYSLNDSGGVIKIAGIGVYVAATDDIARDDKWNWNGTVVDKNPSSNITLSGGTHTIRCTPYDADFNTGGLQSGEEYYSDGVTEMGGSLVGLSATDRIYYVPYDLKFDGEYSAISVNLSSGTGSAGSLKLGLYSIKDGWPDKLIAVHQADISTVTSGTKVGTFDGGNIRLKKGSYFACMTHNESFVMRASNSDSGNITHLGLAGFNTNRGSAYQVKTYADLPDDAASDVAIGFSHNGERPTFALVAA